MKSNFSASRALLDFFLYQRIYGPKLYPNLVTNWRFIWPGPGKRFVSSDRSSYSDSVLLKIRNTNFFEILSISAIYI